MADVHHRIVHYTGHVQGVGFRYQTLQVAKGFEVSGFVCNLADGRVLLEAEGDKEEVEAFISAVGEQMEGYIRKAEQASACRPAQFRGFSLR